MGQEERNKIRFIRADDFRDFYWSNCTCLNISRPNERYTPKRAMQTICFNIFTYYVHVANSVIRFVVRSGSDWGTPSK